MGSDAPLTLEEMVGGWPSLWGPDPSSDGQRILYCYRGTIWQVGLGAEEPQPITQGGDARWAPGGDCFALLRGEPPQVWIRDLGGGERPLLESSEGAGLRESPVLEFCWSPDGRQIATLRPLPEPAHGHEDKPPETIIEVHRRHLPPGPALWVTGMATGRSRQVAQSAPGVGWSSLAWSPDGQCLALLESVVGTTQGEAQLQLAVVELATGNIDHPAGQSKRLVADPCWSPDSTRLALPYSPHDFACPYRLVCGVVAASGGEVECFARDYFLWVFRSLCWHPDNRTIYCLGYRGITGQVLRVDTLTEEVRPLTDAPGVHSILRLTADGRWLTCLYRTPTSFPQVYLLSTDGQERRPLTRVEDPLERYELGETEIVRWRAPDGLELEGILVKPLGCEPGRRYPAIVDLHGGPGFLASEACLVRQASPRLTMG